MYKNKIIDQNLRLFSKILKPKTARTNVWTLMLPHASVAALLLFSSNAHLIAIPATTAAIHYMYRFNHFKKATLYFDMQKLGKNDNYIATFEKIREIMLTDE